MFGMYSFEAKNEKPCHPSSPKRSQGQGSPAFFSQKERYFAQYFDYRHVSRDFNCDAEGPKHGRTAGISQRSSGYL
jgi:hypothetical protein